MSLNTLPSFDGLFDTPATEPAGKPASGTGAADKPKQKRKHHHAPTMYEILAKIAEHGPISNDNIGRVMKVDTPLVERRTSSLQSGGFIVNRGSKKRAAYVATDTGFNRIAEMNLTTVSPPAVKLAEPAVERIVATPPAERTVTRPSKAETVLVRRWYLVNRESKVETLLTEAQASELQKIFPVMDAGA